MTQTILLENEQKRLNHPLRILICFAAFIVWQMGFIYYLGPALNIDGRTPLPISMDNISILIAVAYVFSILFMIFVPYMVIWTGRLAAVIALITAICLFFPFSDAMLRLLIYVQAFCCCYMIGYETYIIVNFLSEQNAIKHLTLAYGIANFMIALVQNDYKPITFPFFRIIIVTALVLLLIFYMHMPASRSAYPRYIKKGDTLVRPTKLMTGTFIIVFVASLIGVSGPSISGEITHGVFITYFVNALVSILIWILYKKYNFHPFRAVSPCIGIGAVGYLLMIASDYAPSLSYLSCTLIGIGLISCQMLPLFSTVLMKVYPSRYYAPITIGLALAAVLVQNSMVEIFRNMPFLLYLIYSIIMVILVFIYLKYEPHFIYVLTEKTYSKNKIPANHESAVSSDSDKTTLNTPFEPEAETTAIEEDTSSKDSVENILEDGLSDNHDALTLPNSLTKREREVLDLISYGYSNADIAKKLVISEHTVNDYTKKIYRKLGVHSRHAAAHFLIKHRTIKKEI